jgi:hypothetical protein
MVAAAARQCAAGSTRDSILRIRSVPRSSFTGATGLPWILDAFPRRRASGSRRAPVTSAIGATFHTATPAGTIARNITAAAGAALTIAAWVGTTGRAVQDDSIKTRVGSAYKLSARNYNIINCFQRLLSSSTCAATNRDAFDDRRLGDRAAFIDRRSGDRDHAAAPRFDDRRLGSNYAAASTPRGRPGRASQTLLATSQGAIFHLYCTNVDRDIRRCTWRAFTTTLCHFKRTDPEVCTGFRSYRGGGA